MRTQIFTEVATRHNAGAFFSKMAPLPNPDDILRRSGGSLEAYRKLKMDPHVWSCIQSRKSGLLSLEWELLPNGAKPETVSIVKAMLEDIDLHSAQQDILEAPLYGWQPIEVVWKKSARNYICIDKLAAKPHEWFFFDMDGKLRFRGRNSREGEAAPDYKVFAVQHEADYLNPYGSALLARCYWPVTFKNGGVRFWVNFMEKYGSPILLAQYSRGASLDESRTLAEELAGMNENAVIVAPSDINIDLKEPARQSSVDLYKELIKHCNAEISKALLSQTLTTELEMGSYAAAKTHFKVREEVILSDIKLVERTLNRIIKSIVKLNFPGSSFPLYKLKKSSLTEINAE